MRSTSLLLFAAAVGLALSCGTAFAHEHGGTFWYTSSTGPYQDECAQPYDYCNTPFHPYPYDRVPGAIGPYLYGPNGHLHTDGLVVAVQEVRKEEARVEPAPPPPAPEPPAPRSQPEGD